MTALSRPFDVVHDTHDTNRAQLHLVQNEMTTKRPARPSTQWDARMALCAVLLVAGWLALAAQWLPGLGPVRPILVFAFVLLAPGTAVVLRLPLVNRAEQAALAVGISAAIAIPVSEAFAFAHVWSPGAVLVTLAVITTTVVVARRPRRAQPQPVWRPLHGPYQLPTPQRRSA